MFGPFRKSFAHGHEANELEAFMNSIEHRDLEPIKYFYYMTSVQYIREILDTGKIEARTTESPYWSLLARDKNAPIGAWLSASLYHSELPVQSPHGENRMKIPCGFILSNMRFPRLFLECFYYFDSNPKNQIVRLVLIDADKYPKETEWCDRKCLRRLNMNDNHMLVLDKTRLVYKCLKNDGVMFPYVWVDVMVVGDVELISVDTIDETPPSRDEATPGTVPPLI